MLRLKIYDGQEKIHEVPLGTEVVTLGRDDASSVTLADLSVSRRHAQIEPSGNFFVIRDNGSTNGTFVNEMVVRLHVLSSGDTIRVGKYLVRVDTRRSRTTDTTRVRVEQLRLADAALNFQTESPATESPSSPLELDDTSRERLLRILEIHTEIGPVDTKETLLTRTLEIALKEMPAERGVFLLFDGGPVARSDLSLERTASRLQPAAVLVRPTSNEEPKGEANEDLVVPQEALDEVLSQPRAMAGALPPPGETEELKRPFLISPIADGGGVHGILFLDRNPSQPSFDRVDLQFLRPIASQVAISLANATLFAEVSRQSSKVEAIVTHLTDGVLVTDEHLVVVEANSNAAELLGLKERNPVGTPFFDLFEDFDLSPTESVLRALGTEKGTIFHLRPKTNPTNAGVTPENVRLLAGRIAPYSRDAAGQQGAVVTIRDRSSAAHIEELKIQVLEKTAHKLRSPLTVIQGNVSFLREQSDALPPDVVQSLVDLESSSLDLKNLVDEFVAYIELRTRSNPFVTSPIQLRAQQLVSETLGSFSEEAARSDMLLLDKVPSDLPCVVAQRELLSRAFREIVSNAVKFGREKTKVVVEGEAANGYVRLDFIDNGPGIPAAEGESVFFAFHQVDAEHTGQVPGAGLGLTIARHIVQAQGGEVQITSPFGFPDRGTRVSVFLPEGVRDSDTEAEEDDLVLLPRSARTT